MAVASAAVALHRLQESDVFWHLSQGRAVLRHLSRSVPEPSAFAELATQVSVAAWLWDALAYASYSAAGFGGVGWLTAAFALAAALATLWMLRVMHPRAPDAALLLVAGIVLALITSRVRGRPEVAALFVLPAFLGSMRRFAASEGRRLPLPASRAADPPQCSGGEERGGPAGVSWSAPERAAGFNRTRHGLGPGMPRTPGVPCTVRSRVGCPRAVGRQHEAIDRHSHPPGAPRIAGGVLSIGRGPARSAHSFLQ
jgi:hypothetical protein